MISWISSNLTAISSTLGTILVAAGAIWVARINGKNAVKAQAVQADATAYETARSIWGDLIDDLRSKITDQRREIDAMRKRFDGEMQTLRARLEDLETKRAGDRRAIHMLTEYAKALLRVLKTNGIDPPTPPDGLDVDIEDG